MSADGTGKFGGCCEILKDVLESDEFEPLIAADEDGILYMSIGVVDVEKEDEPNMVDHPVFFCPFCGTKLQTPAEVDAKTGGRPTDRAPDARREHGRYVQVRAGDARAHGAVGGRRPGGGAGRGGGVHRAPGHAPVISALRPGVIEVALPDASKTRIFVKGGFAEVDADHLTVLAERAFDVEEWMLPSSPPSWRRPRPSSPPPATTPPVSPPPPPWTAQGAGALGSKELSCSLVAGRQYRGAASTDANLHYPTRSERRHHVAVNLPLERHDQPGSFRQATQRQASNSALWPSRGEMSISRSLPVKRIANHFCFCPR